MALFTKKKLSDAERQAWSAQLLEVRAAELAEYGEAPAWGQSWEEHDAEFWRLYQEQYLPQYGLYAQAMMAADGLREAGYRAFVEGAAMLMLADELEQAPSDWSPGQVWWIVDTGAVDSNGNQVWGYQFVSSSWKEATRYMRDAVDRWDLENTRKTNQLWKDAWNRYYKWIAIAIVAIVVIIVLAPIVAGVALGIALGEAISLAGVAAAAGGALAGSGLLMSAKNALNAGGELLGGMQEEVDPFYVDAAAQFQGDDATSVLVGEIASSGSAVVGAGGKITLVDDAPSDPPELNESGGFVPLLLVAASYLIFI